MVESRYPPDPLGRGGAGRRAGSPVVGMGVGVGVLVLIGTVMGL